LIRQLLPAIVSGSAIRYTNNTESSGILRVRYFSEQQDFNLGPYKIAAPLRELTIPKDDANGIDNTY
jgi:hypothetical protein